MRQKVLAVLERAVPTVDFEESKTLVDDSVISSLDLIEIVVDLSSEFDIEIPLEELDGKSFNSLDSIVELVKRHCE